jgi:hypothetical protein
MRVTHTPFSTPTRPIGRDVEVTIALIQALGRSAAPNCGIFHRVLDTIKMFLK